MRNVRLFWQIFPACVGITLLATVLIAWLATTTGHSFFLHHLEGEIRERALLLEPTITILSKGDPERFAEFVRQTGRRAATRITVIDRDGRVMADSSEDPQLMDNHGGRPEVAEALAGTTGYAVRPSRTVGESLLYAAVPVEVSEADRRGVLRLAIPVTPVEAMLRALNWKFAAIGLAVIALAALLSYISARRISRPLEEMRLGAEQLARGENGQLTRIGGEGLSTEMAALAAALNRMAAEIDRRIRLMVQQRNELEAMFASMADPVVAIDAERRVIRLNQAAATLFNLPAGGVQGKAVEGVLRHAELLALIDRALADNSRQDERVRLFAGAEAVLLQTRAVPLRDEQDRSMGVLLVLHDLTRLNRLEHIRQDFVANVSHELKTPITAIRGYVETLLDGALEDTDNARRFLDIVLRQAGRLDAIVDDLLTLSRIENRDGHEAIALAPAPVRPVLESAMQTCAVQAAERGIEVRVEGDSALRAIINAPLLEQAVINLLQNAITYSPSGAQVVLGSEAGRNSEGVEEVRLRVIDNGPGIGREHLGRLFERFYRCDRARGRDQGGTGLGLSIVKHIAQAHQGTVAVDSSLGQGSTFTIILPAAAA